MTVTGDVLGDNGGGPLSSADLASWTGTPSSLNAADAVGSDVEKVTVRDHGHTVQATVQDGRWTAWWPDGNPDGLLTGTVTLTLTLRDGTTRTVDADALMR